MKQLYQGRLHDSTSTEIYYLNGYAEFVKIITMTYSYKYDKFLLELIRGIFEKIRRKIGAFAKS